MSISRNGGFVRRCGVLHKDIIVDIDPPDYVWRNRFAPTCCNFRHNHCCMRRVGVRPCSHFYLQVRRAVDVSLENLGTNRLCSPVSAYWTLSFIPQKCIDEKTHLLAGGVINTLTDFLVFFLPLPTVLALKIHIRQQIILCALFGAGLIVCIAGTVRIYYTYRTTTTFDRTWVSYPLWISGTLELDIGIVSEPTLRTRIMAHTLLRSVLPSQHANHSSRAIYLHYWVPQSPPATRNPRSTTPAQLATPNTRGSPHSSSLQTMTHRPLSSNHHPYPSSGRGSIQSRCSPSHISRPRSRGTGRL